MTIRKLLAILGLTLASLGSPRLAFAAPTDKINDQGLAAQIGQRIQQYPYDTVYDDVNGTIRNGVVTLTGKVTMPHKAMEIAALVARVPGVRRVDNKIETLPLSPFDDQLRMRIALKLFRDPMFVPYAMQAVPPIHIVVENGHVPLTGVVNTELERQKAAMIASATAGVFSVDNKLKLDSEIPSIK